MRSTVSLPQGYSQREVGPPPMPQVQGCHTAPEERDSPLAMDADASPCLGPALQWEEG